MMSFVILSALIVAFAGVQICHAEDDYIETEFFNVEMTVRASYPAPVW